MERLPEYTSAAELAYFADSGEVSEAYAVAEGTLKDLKAAIDDLVWINGTEADRTSYGVATRWKRLKGLFAIIRHRGDKYCPLMMKGIEKALESEVRDADQANLDYDGSERGTQYFSFYLEQYAEVIVGALKKEMGERETHDFESNR